MHCVSISCNSPSRHNKSVGLLTKHCALSSPCFKLPWMILCLLSRPLWFFTERTLSLLVRNSLSRGGKDLCIEQGYRTSPVLPAIVTLHNVSGYVDDRNSHLSRHYRLPIPTLPDSMNFTTAQAHNLSPSFYGDALIAPNC